MEKAKLTLISDSTIQTIELNPSTQDSSIVSTITRSPFRVYQDQKYKIQIELDELQDVTSYYLELNDELLSVSIAPDGSLQASLEDDHVFSQCYGYVKFQLVYFKNKVRGTLESPFISVMVKKGIKNDSVRRMTEYIYQNNSVLLANKRNSNQYKQNHAVGVNKTIEAKLSLLSRIIGILEINYSYFKINSRFKTVHIEKTDYFDKLQYVSSATIQYIAQHPDELRRTIGNTGIVVSGHRYQPERTLITQNAISYDTLENRAIIGFIETLFYDAQELARELEKLINANEYDTYEENDYISSTYYIYISTIDLLKKMKSEVDGYVERIMAVQLAYSRIFNIKSKRLIDMPTPTAVFMSVPQYKQLYDCMNEWLRYADIGLELQNQILGLKKMSEIYELYVLLKLIQYLSASEYELSYADRTIYDFTRKTLYRNTSCNNEFVFTRGDETITLYYQPVIYSGVNDSDYGIGLYRNNTLSLESDNDVSFTGEYYTPDYIIKYQNPNYSGSRFFILDAKFSSIESVLRRQIPKLVFKYVFSISPTDLNDKVIGLYIINGQSEQEEDSVTNVYDRSRNIGMIMPRAEIITMTENSTDNLETHKKILTTSLGRFL